MKRMLAIPMIALALPLVAQQMSAPAPNAAAAANADLQKPVAVVNGETITAERLDRIYDNLGAQMRDQYDKNGGKKALLDNYLRKRLLIQEALKAGFDKRPEVQAAMDSARESALFDHYVRDVVAKPVVTDAEVRAYYDEHKDSFATQERYHVRHIVIAPMESGPTAKTKEVALARIEKVAADLRALDAAITPQADAATAMRLRLSHFADAARRYSEDGSAPSGGDLGFVVASQLDPDFEKAAFSLKPGVLSDVVHTKFGYHLIMVEEKVPAGTEPFSSAQASVREYLMTQKAADIVAVVSRLTNELMATSKVSVFPENIK